MIELQMDISDNRDPTSTILTDKEMGYQVDINPVELFLNMIENCYPDSHTEVERYIKSLDSTPD